MFVVELGTLVVAASDLELGIYSVVVLGMMKTAPVLVVVQALDISVVVVFVVLVCFR